MLGPNRIIALAQAPFEAEADRGSWVVVLPGIAQILRALVSIHPEIANAEQQVRRNRAIAIVVSEQVGTDIEVVLISPTICQAHNRLKERNSRAGLPLTDASSGLGRY